MHIPEEEPFYKYQNMYCFIFNNTLLFMCDKLSRIQKNVSCGKLHKCTLHRCLGNQILFECKPPRWGHDQDREGKVRGIIPEKFLPQYLPGTPGEETHLKRQTQSSVSRNNRSTPGNPHDSPAKDLCSQ